MNAADMVPCATVHTCTIVLARLCVCVLLESVLAGKALLAGAGELCLLERP